MKGTPLSLFLSSPSSSSPDLLLLLSSSSSSCSSFKCIMYHMHLLTLLPHSKEGDRYGSRLSSSYVREDELLAAEPPPPLHVLVAFKDDSPVLKLRRHGEAGWTDHRYTDEDWRLTDIDAFDGLLFGVTADGEHVAGVALGPRVEVELLETEIYEDCAGGERGAGQLATRHHLFDVQSERTVDVVELKTRAARIQSLDLL